MPDEPTTLRELWPLLPDSAFVPLTADATLPVLLFSPHSFAHTVVFTKAEIKGIPHRVKDLYGEDSVRLKQHLDRYPALREAWLLPPAAPGARLEWASAGPGLSLRVEWWSESPSFANSDKIFASSASKTINDLGVISYKSADDFMITPAIGSISTGLHPFLALWTVLLALSSLARYESAAWFKILDIDRSSEANAIEHFLDEAIDSVPAVVIHMLTTFM